MPLCTFGIVVINPADWDTELESQDALPTILTNDPANTGTPQYPSSDTATNVTNGIIYFKSEDGAPDDGPYSLAVLVDTIDENNVAHRDVIYYEGNVLYGEYFVFQCNSWPTRTTVY